MLTHPTFKDYFESNEMHYIEKRKRMYELVAIIVKTFPTYCSAFTES
jgi:hypothetical protein